MGRAINIVWPAYGLHKDVSRVFDSYGGAVSWLKTLWEDRQTRLRKGTE
jgi:hypothetical protein